MSVSTAIPLPLHPQGPYVTSFIEYMNRTTTTFKSLRVFTHASEKAGVSYIVNHLERPTLALIVLRQITPQKVNYVIRQNYTVLPNTNEVIDTGVIGE